MEKESQNEYIVRLNPEDYRQVCELQKKLDDDITILDKKISERLREFDKVFNKKVRWWCLFTIICLPIVVVGIVLCLIFNKSWCLNFEDSTIYCLTAICIVGIIGCILVFREYILNKWVYDQDS